VTSTPVERCRCHIDTGVLAEVLSPGVRTTVQDLPGRRGLWGVGVPPSGAWDDLAFALASAAVGNPADSVPAGLETLLRGPVLRFTRHAVICLAGACGKAKLDGAPVAAGTPVEVREGQVLDLGPASGGLRQYLAVRGGIDVPVVLGSRSTFLAGGFGGLSGRALRGGDLLLAGSAEGCGPLTDVSGELRETDGVLRVIPGPHGAPEYLTEAGVAALFATEWTVDHRSDRTGLRLVGPVPEFARPDGGEAGLHPSNIHDSPYPVGGIMLAGGTPVAVGPDGPSLGGFVVPAVIVRHDRWKLAQARPGSKIRLAPVDPTRVNAASTTKESGDCRIHLVTAPSAGRPAALAVVPSDGERPRLEVRRAGDHHVLVEAGAPELDLSVRVRMHLLAEAVRDDATECVEGVRSVLLASDDDLPALAERVAKAWLTLPDPWTVRIPVRDVTMPIALDDPLVHEAMRRYQDGTRPDAPWCPDNVEFIRRINGLEAREDVFRIVTDATYLVIGLGDVYLGAPVAVPLDPRHRLVTTKYDPPRPWTPANAVGIGGVYLCVYGMEGPGGYQMLGRTVPVWRTEADPPWLLRVFDRLRFVPVSGQELDAIRAERRDLEMTPASFCLNDLKYGEDDGFTARRRAAFAAERARWQA
jgi:urea carboxylase